ncbi:MAG: hypothetical protein FXF47_09890 [Candidatus Mcinerneyibacterium aminivorans]|uniref:DUF5320 domain-containing protein n=1 Tax=Candidatus Mcinerneyibacterium aminivorans TaxID=2703815 RepID=A0A5D0MGE7_9BACT|nr:MAG: hypothetical protein FXF47_09890 [Candidatus Mcinerneyibacterium aminivorans]
MGKCRSHGHSRHGHHKNSCCCSHNNHHGGFYRKFFTAEERIESLKHYKETLENEIKGIEEEIENLKK